jgi:hypothetical protein
MHPDYFKTERRRVWIFGAVLPLIAVGGLAIGSWIPLLGVASLYGLSYVRTVAGLHRDGLPWREAASHASFLSLSKFPNLQGMLTYWRRRMRGKKMELIEYK